MRPRRRVPAILQIPAKPLTLFLSFYIFIFLFQVTLPPARLRPPAGKKREMKKKRKSVSALRAGLV